MAYSELKKQGAIMRERSRELAKSLSEEDYVSDKDHVTLEQTMPEFAKAVERLRKIHSAQEYYLNDSGRMLKNKVLQRAKFIIDCVRVWQMTMNQAIDCTFGESYTQISHNKTILNEWEKGFQFQVENFAKDPYPEATGNIHAILMNVQVAVECEMLHPRTFPLLDLVVTEPNLMFGSLGAYGLAPAPLPRELFEQSVKTGTDLPPEPFLREPLEQSVTTDTDLPPAPLPRELLEQSASSGTVLQPAPLPRILLEQSVSSGSVLQPEAFPRELLEQSRELLEQSMTSGKDIPPATIGRELLEQPVTTDTDLAVAPLPAELFEHSMATDTDLPTVRYEQPSNVDMNLADFDVNSNGSDTWDDTNHTTFSDFEDQVASWADVVIKGCEFGAQVGCSNSSSFKESDVDDDFVKQHPVSTADATGDSKLTWKDIQRHIDEKNNTADTECSSNKSKEISKTKSSWKDILTRERGFTDEVCDKDLSGSSSSSLESLTDRFDDFKTVESTEIEVPQFSSTSKSQKQLSALSKKHSSHMCTKQPSDSSDEQTLKLSSGEKANTYTESKSEDECDKNPVYDIENINPMKCNANLKGARYFVVKSYDDGFIHYSLQNRIWFSTDHGNKRLDSAFRERKGKGAVYLFFSINGSGHFCGIAQMKSAVDSGRSISLQNKQFKGVFSVRWMYVKDVPNVHLRHVRLENNENKPVTNSQDTQEVPSEKGRTVLQIIHEYKHTSSLFDNCD